ncbi:MAG TPA: tyrosine recombinase XerC [Aromatoleum sp.]|uniref:tyrosine recombinase XerC n=1 Tax=Aromatoleum sp. TaxID=2307007 RepID=UPI002B45D471|nr:tyrosine recombinase XerC [Aromatoleum sp.]HJV28454.1 tyrosine recombinase XerC [Aromatoleum sp.]
MDAPRGAEGGPQEPPEWLDAYLDYLATQRRAAPLTLENYRRDLLRLDALRDGRSPVDLTSHDIRRFVARLHAQGLGGRSIARVLSAWRGLYRWLIRHRRALEVNPVEGVRAPKSPQRLPKALSPDQAQALLDAPGEEPLDVRDRAMFELFYSSGLRLAELAALEVDGGLDPLEGMITVRGKRAKMRTVPVGKPALAALQAWFAERAAFVPADGETALFVTRSGGRMSPGAIRSRLAAWAEKCGLGVHVHPHMLRHSFASHLLQSSGDLRAVQELLGHASIRSTQVYTHLDFQHLAKVYDAAHPRAKRR